MWILSTLFGIVQKMKAGNRIVIFVSRLLQLNFNCTILILRSWQCLQCITTLVS
jgi:hypothetical protein